MAIASVPFLIAPVLHPKHHRCAKMVFLLQSTLGEYLTKFSVRYSQTPLRIEGKSRKLTPAGYCVDLAIHKWGK